MKTREVFRIFRKYIDPVAIEHDFSLQRNTGIILPWLRNRNDGRHDLFYCRMNKWPWDKWMGSQFTVRFQNSEKPGIGVQNGDRFAHLGDLLAGQYTREAERLQNVAVAKIQVPTKKEYNDDMGFELADDFTLDEYRRQSQPVKFGRTLGDLRLRITDIDDVTAWAVFLADEGFRSFV